MKEASRYISDTFEIPTANSGIELWLPLLKGSCDWTARCSVVMSQAVEGWMEFLGKRTAAEMNLLQQLSSSKTPYEAWSSYLGFLQKAATDYQSEFSTLEKLSLMERSGEMKVEQAENRNANGTLQLVMPWMLPGLAETYGLRISPNA